MTSMPHPSPPPYLGIGLRGRRPNPARELGENPRILAMRAEAEQASSEPFTGITTDGTPPLGLFPLRATGASTAPIREAAEAFLARLDPGQRAAACFPIDSEQWRRWHNISGFVTRHGQLIEALPPAGREAALDLLRATLSTRGFTTARDVMRLNYTIGEITGSWTEYGEWVYWLSIFGTPSPTEPWGWQIDGHHLNLNCFVLGDQVVLSPMFMGSEPVLAETGIYTGTRVFEAEERDGLAFARTLTPAQRATAVLADSIVDDRPPEIAHRVQNNAFDDNRRVPNAGITTSDLNSTQRDTLVALTELYVGRLTPAHARVTLDDVTRHLDATRFVWMGGMEDDSVYYYRIHSPVILAEFDHQRGVALDNDYPARTHIHTIVRTPNGNDYGKDLLRQHYAQHHSR